MISLLTPTRNRPTNVKRMVRSARQMVATARDLEFVFYVDNDDDSFPPEVEYNHTLNVKVVRGPRIVLSEMWNKCYEAAEGPFYIHMGDDIVFTTPHWDIQFMWTFSQFEDKIIFAYCDDGSPNGKTMGTHGMLHKNWVEAVGYFVPPYFSSDYNDLWLNEVAEKLGRKVFVDGVVMDHLHPVWHKAEWDETHRQRLERHERDGVAQLYEDLHPKREEDMQKLLKAIHG